MIARLREKEKKRPWIKVQTEDQREGREMHPYKNNSATGEKLASGVKAKKIYS